jgi:deferrochelatase/peroxidase EfeB
MAWADHLAQIQGFLVRGYTMLLVRHFALSVSDAAAARRILASFTDGSGVFQITSAAPWGAVKPEYCLNVGFTYGGLKALGVPDATLASFATPDHQPFVDGAVKRAPFVGDIGASAPDKWVLDDSRFDILLSLYVNDQDTLDRLGGQLEQILLDGFAAPAADRIVDTQVYRDGQVYFGYEDGIGQPILAGDPFSSEPDGGQDLVDPGAFMLGTAIGLYYASVPVPKPAQFGQFGCFAAFRVLRQDVEGFEKQVDALAPAVGAAFKITDPALQRDAVKAQICGRWPNGTSLTVFPIQGDTPPPLLPAQKINDFLYVDEAGKPDMGQGCPIGSHARRGNMRLAQPGDISPAFAGAPTCDHRILRRAMPYQLPYNPDNPDDPATERGLAGLFLGTSLMEQWEFVQHNWINNPDGFYIVLDPADPLMGDAGSMPMFETAPTDTKPPGRNFRIKPMANFVFTKASAYIFFPGIDGIRFVAGEITPA